MMNEIKTAYRAASNFCERFQHAQTSEDFKRAAEEWLRLDGLVADVALVSLRAMERRVFGNDVYMKSEVDKALKMRLKHNLQNDASRREMIS